MAFLSNLNVKPPCANAKPPPQKRKSPYWGFSGDGSAPNPKGTKCNSIGNDRKWDDTYLRYGYFLPDDQILNIATSFQKCKNNWVDKYLPYKFSAAVLLLHYVFFYHVVIDLKIENLVKTQQTKSTLGCARTLSERSWLSIFEQLLHSFEIFREHSSYNCQHWASDQAKVVLKLLPFLKICMWHCIMSFIEIYDYAVSLTTLSVQLHIYATCNKLYGKMCSSKHCS